MTAVANNVLRLKKFGKAYSKLQLITTGKLVLFNKHCSTWMFFVHFSSLQRVVYFQVEVTAYGTPESLSMLRSQEVQHRLLAICVQVVEITFKKTEA